MKKIIAVTAALVLAVSLVGCGVTQGTTGGEVDTVARDTAGDVQTAALDREVTAEEATGDFKMTSEDGTFTSSGDVYTISSAGTYTATGLLEGQILVEAGEEDEVVIELSGATVTCGSDSPIKITSAGKVEISAKKDTENVINDTRAVKTADDESQGEGAIYAKCDLKIKGNGTLVVNGGYNNGIHTTKDLKIQNLSLKITSYNNAIKGNDSITVTSGTVAAISTHTASAAMPPLPGRA